MKIYVQVLSHSVFQAFGVCVFLSFTNNTTNAISGAAADVSGGG